jgi:hypothetical protein
MTLSKSGAPQSSAPRNRFSLNASFEEMSVWVQLLSLVLGLGGYFVVAGRMLSTGVHELIAFMPLFALAVAFIVAVNVAGHIVAAIAHRSAERDERDRLIAWRAESRSSWILGAGVVVALTLMLSSIGEVWIAHLLLLSLALAEVAKAVAQLVYYRRGV